MTWSYINDNLFITGECPLPLRSIFNILSELQSYSILLTLAPIVTVSAFKLKAIYYI